MKKKKLKTGKKMGKQHGKSGKGVGDESHYEPCFQERPAPLINCFPYGKECLKVKGRPGPRTRLE